MYEFYFFIFRFEIDTRSVKGRNEFDFFRLGELLFFFKFSDYSFIIKNISVSFFYSFFLANRIWFLFLSFILILNLKITWIFNNEHETNLLGLQAALHNTIQVPLNGKGKVPWGYVPICTYTATNDLKVHRMTIFIIIIQIYNLKLLVFVCN